MATSKSDTDSKKSSSITKEEENFLRIAILLYKVAPVAVRVKFNYEFNPGGLQIVLNQNRYKILEPLRKKCVINQTQWELLFPKTGVACSDTFDVTLMICLIRNLTPIRVIDFLPSQNDTSPGADLSRIKFYRNKIAHTDNGCLLDTVFHSYWDDITEAMVRLGGSNFRKKCDVLKDCNLNAEDREMLIELKNNLRRTGPVPVGVQSIYDIKIEEWKLLDEKVVITRAIEYLIQIIKTENTFTVFGPSGCGKSTAIHHVALYLFSKEKYMILPVASPSEILSYYDPHIKQVFVIDDAFGKFTLDFQKLKDWETSSDDINIMLSKGSVKILASCRSHIVQNRHFDNVKILSQKKFDIHSFDLALTQTEKKLIAELYLEEPEAAKIMGLGESVKFDCFPLLCHYYAKNKIRDVEKFFSCPVQVIKDDLTHIMNASDQTTYATLVLFVIYNNSITDKMLQRKSDSKFKDILNEIAEMCDPVPRLTVSAVKSHLESLKDSYVKKTGNEYCIIHDKFFDILVSFYGNLMFDLVLEFCHSDIIRDRYQFKSLKEDQDECIITIPCEKEEDYFNRLYEDINNGFVGSVFSNRQLKFSSYRKKFVKSIRKNTEACEYLVDVSDSQGSPLLIAADQGYSDIAEMLVKLKLNVNVQDSCQRTPLLNASWKGNYDIVTLLLKENCNPNILDRDDTSPLYAASCHGHRNIVKILLKNKGNPNLLNKHKRSPLLIAATEGYDDILKLLLEHGCNPDESDENGLTPLIISTKWGRIESVRILLKYNCSPDICGKDNKSALHVAVSGGYNEIVLLLLQYKSNPNLFDKFGETILYTAASQGESMLEILLENSQISEECYASSLLTAVTKGEEDVVRRLLEHDCIPPLAERFPILGMAVELMETEIVKLLFQYRFHKHEEQNSIPKWFNQQYERIVSIQEHLYQRASTLLTYTNLGYSETFAVFIESHVNIESRDVKIRYPLLEAVRNGNIEIVKLFIEYKCDLDLCDRFQETPLFVAVKNSQEILTKMLLENGCKTDVYNVQREFPLYLAAGKGDYQIVELLLKHGCYPSMCNMKKESALYAAIRNGHTKIVELLLDHNCNPAVFNDNDESPLYIACQEGKIDIVAILLKLTPVCESMCNDKSLSPLNIAAYKGDTNIIKMLLSHGVDPDLCDCTGIAPIFVATCEGYNDIVKILLESSCNPNVTNKENQSPLYAASAKGKTEIVRLLLEFGSNPNLCSTSSSIAVWGEPLETGPVIFLLGHSRIQIGEEHFHGHDMKDSRSPLLEASINGFTEIVKLLLKNKCDPNLCDKNKETPLYAACSAGDVEIVKVLLENNALFDLCNNDNMSPLHMASFHGHTDIVKLLLQHDCNVNYQNKHGDSPLHFASVHGHNEIVKLLLDFEANPHQTNRLGHSSLYTASSRGFTQIVRMLLNYGYNSGEFDQLLQIAFSNNHIDIMRLLLNSSYKYWSQHGYMNHDQKHMSLRRSSI